MRFAQGIARAVVVAVLGVAAAAVAGCVLLAAGLGGLATLFAMTAAAACAGVTLDRLLPTIGAGWRCTRCGASDASARLYGCALGPCPMEPVR